jgi:hypothetical protein
MPSPLPSTAEVPDVISIEGLITGNADIVCERGTPTPDYANTLPIYPKPSDFYPQGDA